MSTIELEPTISGPEVTSLTAFFTTTVFLDQNLPSYSLITLPGRSSNRDNVERDTADAILRDAINQGMFAGGYLSSSFVTVPGNLVESHIVVFLENTAAQADTSSATAIGLRNAASEICSSPIPVMNSPIVGTTLNGLWKAAGGGAALLSTFPNIDGRTVALYFLVVGGTRIVLLASDGIGYALKHGLAYVLLKWMGAPTEFVEQENKKVQKMPREDEAAVKKKRTRTKNSTEE
jgi:hypothetical protein